MLGNLGLAYSLWASPESHRVLRAGPEDLSGDRRPAKRRNRPGQPGDGLLGSGRAPQSHRVLRAGPEDLSGDRRPARRRSRPGQPGAGLLGSGRAPKAIEFHEQALKISREIGDRRGEGTDLGNLGLAYSDLGEPRKPSSSTSRPAIAREIRQAKRE